MSMVKHLNVMLLELDYLMLFVMENILNMQLQKDNMLFFQDSQQEDIQKLQSKIGNADPGDQVKFGVDPTGPTGGSLLANLIQTPSLMERAQQGREVGYAIIAVGIIAVYLPFISYIVYT